MEILGTSAACFPVDEDLLNFNLEGEGEEEDLTISKGASASSSSVAAAVFGRGPFPVSSTPVMSVGRVQVWLGRVWLSGCISVLSGCDSVGEFESTRTVGSNSPARLTLFCWICEYRDFVVWTDLPLETLGRCFNWGVFWGNRVHLL